jgi:hypothetical protein
METLPGHLPAMVKNAGGGVGPVPDAAGSEPHEMRGGT